MSIIWESQLDNIFDCKVTRISDRTGQLTVRENITGQLLLDKEVGLSYGAHFGPDVADVGLWQELCVNAVDNRDEDTDSRDS